MKKLAIALLALCAPIDALTGIESVEIDTWAFSISYKKHAKKAARAVKSAYEDAVVAVADFWKKARVVSGGVYVDGKAAGVIRVKVGRANGKGVVSVSGAITGFDGRKLSASGGRVVVDGESLTVALKVKDGSTATVTVGKDGIAGSWSSAEIKATVGGSWTKGAAAVRVDFAGGSALPSGTIEALLPIEEPVAAKGGKWVFDKAAKVTMKNGVVQGIDDPKKPNLSGMKLTYAPKTGVFKGSFRLYADLGGRLKRRSVSVSGFVVGGAGHGRATIKKPAASWSVSVE